MGHLGTYGNIFFALDCFTLPRNHHIPNTGLFAILFNHSSISFATIHRHKTCINCRVKKMTTWLYIANVIQSPLPWCHHIYQIVAVYWRLKLPWKSAYEIIPANWKSLAPTLHLHFFSLSASSKQIPDYLQEPGKIVESLYWRMLIKLIRCLELGVDWLSFYFYNFSALVWMFHSRIKSPQ